MFDKIMIVLQVFFGLIGLYQVVLSFFGWYRKKENVSHSPQKTFAVLVAAHNEEEVVGALLENLQKMKYPREMYDIFVICDNCTDKTEAISRSYEGVTPCVRTNPEERGKGFALEWMLNKLWEMPKSYDAVVVFDADNLVDVEFLQYMNNDLCNGTKVIQGYLDTKNPGDSWISASNAINYWFCNRLWQLPRYNLGLSNFLGGTGMCFESKLLKEMGWGATSLVEDLEFTIRCIQRDVYPKINFDARVYDEKPLTFRASARQRLRWMQGHFEVTRKFLFPLIKQGIKERSLTKIDAALYVFNSYNFLFGFLLTIIYYINFVLPMDMNITSLYGYFPLWVAIPLSIYGVAQLPLAMYLEKVPLKMYWRIITYPIFLISWWPITVHAFFTQNNKQWSHTKHTRVVRLEEVQSKQV
ncbi:glycosyltransferase family 2 protein [Paenibacillus pini]|uniref:N-acetylglucosaminyltransferase n=1 Tax=Paenibacillus pini JCM 16418 TaxID=1236976 RepID=W7YNE4_9BACL|nr:glycosyltransferase family 2 protein [Paenibacillus pini]GAF06151.1 N-acetylglucosaminyltransferase [Paenibacillus pini JCM 16418]